MPFHASTVLNRKCYSFPYYYCLSLQSISVYRTKRRSTWHTAASLSLTSPVVRDCARHIITSWTCHVINAVPRPSHIFCRQTSRLELTSQTSWEMTLKTVVLGSHWKHCFSVGTSVSSAFEVYLYTTIALYKSKFYLLIYSVYTSGRGTINRMSVISTTSRIHY